MGYSKDQEGIIDRYINEEGSWQEHLRNSQAYIKETIETKSIEKVAILGSGWLLDVPIDFLSRYCKKVFLYDIRHPRQIIQKLKKYNNVEFVNIDITSGGIAFVYDKIKKKDFSSFGHFPELIFKPLEPVDYIISVNLLNQLDILMVEYLRQFKQINEADLTTLRQTIQLNHIKSLPTDKSCLITDFEELIYDRTNNLVENRSLIFNSFPQGKNIKEWIWQFDNTMSYYPNRKTHFKVKALQL
jgi:hypothetical protein